MSVVEILDEILHPKSVAVVGASGSERSWGYSYTTHLLEYGFRGKLYPVNPRYPEILGLKAYPSLLDIPGTVDYVISCVPSNLVLGMLEECGQKQVKAVHLYTARFSETGRKDAADLEQEVLKRARKYNIRLIGPNCMGVYHPGHGMSFGYNLPKEAGTIGMLSQTGGGAALFVRLAGKRGLRFSKVISYGNALDFSEADYLEYFTEDTETTVITVYVEGVRDGHSFFPALRRAARKKPVIVIKGGRGEAGTRAVASHTASLAGSLKTWEAMVTQAGAVSAANFDEMVDLATSFHNLPPIRGAGAGIVGGGGGPSVLAADECEEEGLVVVPLPDEIRKELRDGGIEIWDWVSNPVDVSIIGGFGFTDLDMMRLMGSNENYHILIGRLNENVMFTLSRGDAADMRLKSTIEGYRQLKEEIGKPLLVVVSEDGSGSDQYGDLSGKVVSQARTDLIKAGIPFYPSMGRAARAARKVLDYYLRKDLENGP
ncbi:MAG: CoA-binding protein [Dehalococcoidales bacterium]|nr:CoA-binding protein [Dehalococcoidales bacterium]